MELERQRGESEREPVILHSECKRRHKHHHRSVGNSGDGDRTDGVGLPEDFAERRRGLLFARSFDGREPYTSYRPKTDGILLIDDDVLFQRDLASLFETSMPDGKLLQASCAMYKVRQDEDGSRWLKLSRAE